MKSHRRQILRGLSELQRMFIIVAPAFIVMIGLSYPAVAVIRGDSLVWLLFYPIAIVAAAWFIGDTDERR